MLSRSTARCAPAALAGIRQRAMQTGLKKFIAFPEVSDERVIPAVAKVLKEKIAQPVLVGDREAAYKCAKANNVSLEGVRIIDPALHPEVVEQTATVLFQKRQKKGMTIDAALDTVKNSPLMMANLMLTTGHVQGCVAGASHTSADVARAALQTVGVKKGLKTASSFFIIAKDDKTFLFSDCGFCIAPSISQLAEIAITTAQTCEDVLASTPRIAMLSFSTFGSAKHEYVTRVEEALALARKERPDLAIDGEMQVDAAIVPEVAAKKAPGSKVAGHANVLIFPDLNAGNIAYKVAERFGGYQAVGPVFQGLAYPTNDLSRGCHAEDVVDAAAVTVLQGASIPIPTGPAPGDVLN
ncbi:Phosphate acetyltransferase, putative [Perkinsus marinus ATCC 50983]|uniref:Phosphate acetyltransferase n=1 Tax=Perkinsus marinus (strain ATCC 50983 / TXsc) TaxID=423536 RepID=C5L492_PERM5|nr:Phosphate acetyltransferase, putative [Perkinsus marinus ATCC 50983]EER08451.1 Phosphate acetyltransferase, putative [Perkinsus marinus ATCC 50983]|eukprot:XP_002776635.1 Phosphate acetyltransferase, putative [Perkinsus marinus ATCC 50983]